MSTAASTSPLRRRMVLWLVLLVALATPAVSYTITANATEAQEAESAAAEEAAANEQESAADAAGADDEAAAEGDAAAEADAAGEGDSAEEADADEEDSAAADDTGTKEQSEEEAAEAVGVEEAAVEEGVASLLTLTPEANCPLTGGTGTGLAAGFEIDGNCGVQGNIDWDSPQVGPSIPVNKAFVDSPYFFLGAFAPSPLAKLGELA
jgi:hypothetical protein